MSSLTVNSLYSKNSVQLNTQGIAKQRNIHMNNGAKRSDIQIGQKVSIVLKQDQRTGKLTEGVVKDILTKSPTHPHGIKVRLENGFIGRVKSIHAAE